MSKSFGKEIIARNVHLYTVRNNKWEHWTGEVWRWSGMKKAYFTMIPAPEGRSHFGYDCSLDAGKVYSATIWFPEEMEKQAIKALRVHQEIEINKLKIRMDNHQKKYSLLRELTAKEG